MTPVISAIWRLVHYYRTHDIWILTRVCYTHYSTAPHTFWTSMHTSAVHPILRFEIYETTEWKSTLWPIWVSQVIFQWTYDLGDRKCTRFGFDLNRTRFNTILITHSFVLVTTLKSWNPHCPFCYRLTYFICITVSKSLLSFIARTIN